MEPVSLVKEISELFSAHEVPFHVEEEWVVPHGRLPAIRATWFPREDSGLLEVETLLNDERIINECFAGIGEGRNGISDALQNFCVNTFHVLLAAFWGVNEPDQVMVESWKIKGKSYTAYVGNLGTRGSDGVEPIIPDGLFDSVEKAILGSPQEGDTSWYRVFFCNVSGDQTFEALKNNEVWEAGLSSLKALPWVKVDGYYSVRNFLIVRENA